MPVFTGTEIGEAYGQEIGDPRKRRHRCAPWRHYEAEKAEQSPARYITPVPGLQRMGRGSAMELLRRTMGEGQLEFVPEFGWVCRSSPEAGIASDNDIRREVMGTWLGQLAVWTHFCTWTFSRPVTVAAAMHFGGTHLRWLARWDVDTECGETVRRDKGEPDGRKDERARQKAAKKRLQAFLATERGETGGLIHLHALVAKITHVQPFCGVRLPDGEWGVKCCMVHSWPCGYARVIPYDPGLGAKHYVSKYVIKGHLAELDLVGNFHCRGRACSLALH